MILAKLDVLNYEYLRKMKNSKGCLAHDLSRDVNEKYLHIKIKFEDKVGKLSQL